MYDTHTIWQSVLAEFELKLSKANFTTWFKNTGIKHFDTERIVICVPSNFAKEWLEKKHHQEIVKLLENITNQPVKKIEYVVENIKVVYASQLASTTAQEALEQNPLTQPEEQLEPISSTTNLNPRYTFDTFIVGKGSELAVAAARAVVDRPGMAYNPLFIYGAVGLGKTHILQAVGNEILKNRPEKKILYTSIEKFKNDLVEAVRSGDARKLKSTYRNVDVLLIDDIQFISGKEGTQEEFFHTFNELHQQNKQVVLSSDRPPKAIPALEARLRTRFEWGMIVDVTAPDLETRFAIIQTKANERGIELSDEVVQIIATSIQNNIRELEGAVNKVAAFHQLNNTKPTVETVKALLSQMDSRPNSKSISPKQIVKTVAEFFDIRLEDLTGKSREKRLAFPRQIAMFLLREEIKLSFPAIGEELGGRDHTTAMHAHSKIEKENEESVKLKTELELIKQRLYNNPG